MNIQSLKDYFLFKRFLMPVVLQILFWGAIGGVLYGTWWLYSHENWAWIMSLLFGIPATRLIFESLIIRYQSYQYIKRISERLEK